MDLKKAASGGLPSILRAEEEEEERRMEEKEERLINMIKINNKNFDLMQ